MVDNTALRPSKDILAMAILNWLSISPTLFTPKLQFPNRLLRKSMARPQPRSLPIHELGLLFIINNTRVLDVNTQFLQQALGYTQRKSLPIIQKLADQNRTKECTGRKIEVHNDVSSPGLDVVKVASDRLQRDRCTQSDCELS